MHVVNNENVSFDNLTELKQFIDQLNDQAKTNDNSTPQDITNQRAQLSEQANDQTLALINAEVRDKVIATKYRQEQNGAEPRPNLMRQYYDLYCLLTNEEEKTFIRTEDYTT